MAEKRKRLKGNIVDQELKFRQVYEDKIWENNQSKRNKENKYKVQKKK